MKGCRIKMILSFFSPDNLSQKLLRVIFSIYIVVTCIVTSVQFVTEYLKTQEKILVELKQLEQTFSGPISTSLWQYDQKQLESLATGLIAMPIIEGVDILDNAGGSLVSKRSFDSGSVPLSIFSIKSDLVWVLNGVEADLGSLTLYSSSQVVLDRVWFGFILIFITASIKISILFYLFIWAVDRFLSTPLKNLMSQVADIQIDKNTMRRIDLSITENNELRQLQEHMNIMLSVMEKDRERLLEDEQEKRIWLEEAVTKRTIDLQVANEKLKELAAKDSLTGALSRGFFYESAQNLLNLSQRKKSHTSFVLMDLDHFKMVNDTYGHSVGDIVLIHFASTVQALLRSSDLFGRVGGEEFALFLADTDVKGAFHLTEKLRVAIGSSALEVDGKIIKYTVSQGIASAEPKDKSVDELFKRADLKLYKAKEGGRNCVQM